MQDDIWKYNLFFQVELIRVNKRDRCPMITISTDTKDKNTDFIYSNIKNMYISGNTQGHGIQVNNPKYEKSLIKMCDKIADIVYNTVKELDSC